jgi:hypothetical protein
MIGANGGYIALKSGHEVMFPVYQASDKPRYFKANKGLIVICVWMCVSNGSG